MQQRPQHFIALPPAPLITALLSASYSSHCCLPKDHLFGQQPSHNTQRALETRKPLVRNTVSPTATSLPALDDSQPLTHPPTPSQIVAVVCRESPPLRPAPPSRLRLSDFFTNMSKLVSPSPALRSPIRGRSPAISAPHALHFQIPILPARTPPSLMKRISSSSTPNGYRSACSSGSVSSASSSTSDLHALCGSFSAPPPEQSLSPKIPCAPAPTPDDCDPDVHFPAMPAALPPRRPRLDRRDTPRPPISPEADRIVALALPASTLGLEIPDSPPNHTSAHRSLLYHP
ncbi:hypothetical protein A1Q2_05416 [Trichosporon asahii var. asahii CBS 8904]|uniref:Uncharacterized protein n=1 Tax=Trichosporon asahii var. asahii (strain CBS 8904) TaxID=1220162 RepID=K1WFA5_TRIAC|nr:hypothetical protein A1Q2_05416 [Trichosporon asahii var. asahii CBS 8904]